MDARNEILRAVTRRHFFLQGGLSVGAMALASLLGDDRYAAAAPLQAGDPAALKPPQSSPRAKNVIYLFMSGGPSQLDLFDHKPRLSALDGQKVPDGFMKGERFAFIKGALQLLGSPYKFKNCGQSGAPISDLLPHLSEVVDEIAIVKSMYSEQFNHAPAQLFANTGHQLPGRPSMGSWLSYGLGSESRELPGFVVLQSGPIQVFAGNSCWGCGFLPTTHQGVEFRSQGDPVLFVSSPSWLDKQIRRRSLDTLRQVNQMQFEEVGDPEILTRISSYELAYRMQTSVPELMDISKEPEAVHRMYGTQPGKVSFANNCLLARRLVERGVRFVQLYHHGWDHHGEVETGSIIYPAGLPTRCKEVDQASAALIKDLKQRGLLDNTVVLWGGEFGRTPISQNPGKYPGRDHHPYAFTIWAAGGGIKPGITVGETDELGYRIVADKIDVHDLHATLLHLMGVDHTKLVYKFQGRNFRLTDVAGTVVEKLLL
jgi:Protein of unknown function (DUF1501)